MINSILPIKLIVVGISILFFYSCKENKNNENSSSLQEKTNNVKSSVITRTINKTNNLYLKGKDIFKQNCQACHQTNGEGLPNTFPPLAKSDYLLADKARSIKQVIKGSSGEITVNGQKFNSTMPPQNLTDEQIADVLNYILHSWGNNGEIITAEEVKKQREN